jgi:hypothetical protein
MKALELFQNPDGSYSSRRFAGLAMVGVGIALAFITKDAVLVAIFTVPGFALLGLTTGDQKAPA